MKWENRTVHITTFLHFIHFLRTINSIILCQFLRLDMPSNDIAQKERKIIFFGHRFLWNFSSSSVTCHKNDTKMKKKNFCPLKWKFFYRFWGHVWFKLLTTVTPHHLGFIAHWGDNDETATHFYLKKVSKKIHKFDESVCRVSNNFIFKWGHLITTSSRSKLSFLLNYYHTIK